MSNEESVSAGGVSRRTPRQGVGGSPVGSTLSIVLAVVAVIAGFLILRNITDSGDDSSSPDSGATSGAGTTPEGGTTVGTGLVIPDIVPVDTTIPESLGLVTAGATVVVLNANTTGGSAGSMTKTLQLRGYTMGVATDATGDNVDVSIVYYDSTNAAALDVANSVARDLGGLAVEVVPTPPPTANGDLGGAGVLLLLGDAQAGKSIEELSGATETATPVVEAPAPAGGATTGSVVTTTADG